MKTFGTNSRHWLAGIVFAGFVLRALTPAGYMPAPIGADGPFALCPNSNPGLSQLLSQVGGPKAHHHGAHDHNAQGTPGAENKAPWESCKFGAASGAAAPVADIRTDIPVAAPVLVATTIVTIIRAMPLRTIRVRGPPTVHL
jgi:hypothetical protein